MKRFLTLLSAALLAFMLSGCTRAAGGSYKLSYITADGVRIPPSSVGMVMSLTLDEDGVGMASYGADTVEITWSDEGGTVLVTGSNGELSFTKDGSSLILHSEGTLLFFTPDEDES